MNALVVSQGLLIYGLLSWKLTHLARVPRDLPLRCVVACLGCAAIAYPIGVAYNLQTVPADAGWLMAAQLSFLLSTVYFLDCFSSSRCCPHLTRASGRSAALSRWPWP